MIKIQRMPFQNIVNSDESTAAWIASLVVGSVTYTMQMMNMETINSGIVTITTLLALVFTALKIRGQHLENKSKQLDNEMKQRKMDDDEID